MEHRAGVQQLVKRRSTAVSRYPSPWWAALLHEPGVLPALVGRVEQRLHRPGLARPLIGREAKPNGDLRTVLRLPVEIEHLLIAESTWLVRELESHPRRDVAIANPVRWENGFWARPPYTSSQRKKLTRRLKAAESSIARVAPFAAKGDVKEYFASLTPHHWNEALAEATGIPIHELLRQLQRLRNLAVEVAPIIGPVVLPVGPELSDVAGNGVLLGLDQWMVARCGTAGYARYVDDLAFGTRGIAEGMRGLAEVEAGPLKALGLQLNWDKCDVVVADALRIIGDTYIETSEPGAAFNAGPSVPFLYSRARAKGLINALTEQATSSAGERLADISPRLLAARHQVRKGLHTFGRPLPSELSSHLLKAIKVAAPRTASLSTTGDLLLDLAEGGIELDQHGRRALTDLALNPALNHHTTASASWVLAAEAETFDHRILERLDELVSSAARGVLGASVRAGHTCDYGLRRQAHLTA